MQPVYRSLGMFISQSFPVSEQLSEFGFYLPSGTGNTNEEIEFSAHAFLEIVGN